MKLQKTTMGRPKEFPTEDYDFGIAIRPEENNDLIVRVLHCNPTLCEGSTVDLGDKIGTAIRSRYFNYWTGPHYHIEVMSLDSFSRSTQSFGLEVPFIFSAQKSKELATTTEFVISVVNEDHIVGFPRRFSHIDIGGYGGLAAIDEKSRTVGILDGGISHYAHGGVIGHEYVTTNSKISLQNQTIGVIQKSLKSASFFTRGPSIKSYLDELELRGLSCFVYPNVYNKQGIPPLVLVPKEYRQFVGKFSEGDVCVLRLDSDSNMVKAE
jgi:hypothetical protein